MPRSVSTVVDGSIEECVDAIGEFIGSLERFPDVVIAHALQVHLCALLRELRHSGRCTSVQAREFLADMAREIG